MPALVAAAAPHPTITLLQTSSLSSVVQGELERMILSGELRAGRQAHRDGARRPPRRLARAAARGLPHARGSGPGAHREEPRRLRARPPGRRSRSRSSTCAPRWTSSSAAASPSRSRRRQLKEIRAPGRRRWSRRSRRKDAHALPPAQPALPRPPGRARRQRQADRDLPQADQGAEPVPPPQPGRRLADADLGQRAPPDRQGDRLGRRRGRRPGDVRPRHGEQGAHDQEPLDGPAAAARAPAAGREKASAMITVNGRSYRSPHQPTVVVCVDGCEPDYLAQAVAHGHVPWLKRGARDRHGADRRLRGPELHQPEQPVDRHRRAAVGARHLRQLLLRLASRRRGDDERPEVPARADASWPRSPTPAQRSPWSPPRTSCASCSAIGMKGICFSAEKADEVTRGRERHRRRARALVGMPVPSVYSAELSEFVFAAGVKLMSHDAPPGRDVPLDHRLRAAQARARAPTAPTRSTR